MSAQGCLKRGSPNAQREVRSPGAELRFRGGLAAAVLGALAGCAQVPPAPESAPAATPAVRRAPAVDEQLNRAIARHLQLAQQYKQSGDLPAAAAQWQILTVLAPKDDSYRSELAAARAAVARRVQENLNAGTAALRSGDADRAADAMLRVLALDPENTEAAQALRDIEKRRASRVQAGRAARVSEAAGGPSARAAAPRTATPIDPVSTETYSLELPLEMFRAGDNEGGLRELRQFVDQNPNDRAARNKIGTVVYERGRELETQGQREQALVMYQQAVSLRGEPAPGWAARVQALKKALGDEYFDKGVQAWSSDPALAVKQWETSLRYDPSNTKSAARLKDARVAQVKGSAAAK
jgi:tetratricopeptide (TPR) repeat protein